MIIESLNRHFKSETGFFRQYIYIYLYLYLQDLFSLNTPGGGGFGKPDKEDLESGSSPAKRRRTDPVSSHHYVEKGSVYAYRMAQESA